MAITLRNAAIVKPEYEPLFILCNISHKFAQIDSQAGDSVELQVAHCLLHRSLTIPLFFVCLVT